MTDILHRMARTLSSALRAPGSDTNRWHMPTGYPLRNFHTQNILRFTRGVEKSAGSKFLITVYPDGSLYPAPKILSAVESGQAQLGELLMANMAREMPLLGLDSVPFVISGYEDARNLWRLSRPAIEQAFKKSGLVLLFAVPWPPQGLYANRSIDHIRDLRGLRCRTYDHMTTRIAELTGLVSVPIQAADLPRAVSAGTIDVMFTSSATGIDAGAWDRFTHYYDINAWMPKNVVFANKHVYESVTDKFRDALTAIATDAEDRGWKASEEKDRVLKAELVSRGMKVLLPNEALKSGFHLIGETLTQEWLTTGGPDAADIIKRFRRGIAQG